MEATKILVHLEITAENAPLKPFPDDEDETSGRERWYVLASWKDGEDYRFFAHKWRFNSPTEAERNLHRMRDAEIVTAEHILKSPYWRPYRLLDRANRKWRKSA